MPASPFIPAGTILQIGFPNSYSASLTPSCEGHWDGASSLICTYANHTLNVSGGFPNDLIESIFQLTVSGIVNPEIAKTYAPFVVSFIFPNGSSSFTPGNSNEVKITPAEANCSITFLSGIVQGIGVMEITYLSKKISSNMSGYTISVSMSPFYPSDPSQSFINPSVNTSSTLEGTYLLTFPFTNTFTLSMKMPPSTQPESDFITVSTSNSQGKIDQCTLSISGVQPNAFAMLAISSQPVQTLSNLTVTLFPSILLPGDSICINFTSSEFDLTTISNLAIFSSGVLGSRNVVIDGKLIKITNVVDIPLVSMLNFTITGILFPSTTAPQPISIFTQTSTNYFRDFSQYTYSNSPGSFISPKFACLTSQIGSSTTCTLSVTLGSQVPSTGYICMRFGSGFRIKNSSLTCSTSGGSLNSLSTCTGFESNNSIVISNLISSGILTKNMKISVSILIALPDVPGVNSITITSMSMEGYLMDRSIVEFVSEARVLNEEQIAISSSSLVTGSSTVYTVNLTLPLNLGIEYTFLLYIPFPISDLPSVNNGLLVSEYNSTTKILKIFATSSKTLLITNFITHSSTAPITLKGELYYNDLKYFYFNGYDIAMKVARDIYNLKFEQNAEKVGSGFIAKLYVSGLEAGDVMKIPVDFYGGAQGNCSSNVECRVLGSVKMLSIDNEGLGLTSFTLDMVNLGYIGSKNLAISVYESTETYLKQVGTILLKTTVPNTLNITSTQTNPYYRESSIYTFDVQMTTIPPLNSIDNYLIVSLPEGYLVGNITCILGCTVDSIGTGNRSLQLKITSTGVRFNAGTVNPLTFNNPIEMTSASMFGQMDYGSYIPLHPCQFPCRSCLAENTSSCLSCYSWSSENKLGNNTCSNVCPTSNFYNNTSLKCELCHSYCLSCVDNSTFCYSCKSNYFWWNMQCYSICPLSTYGEGSQCRECSNHCEKCSSGYVCEACTVGWMLLNGSCQNTCPNGTYPDTLIGACVNCSSNCLSCNSTSCLACVVEYYSYQKNCYLECPTGLYKSTLICEACRAPCSSCSILSTNCTQCLASVAGQLYFYFNNTCFENACPNSYYVGPLDNNCIKCESPCDLCNRTHCLSCSAGFYFYKGLCSSECRNGTYGLSNFTCLDCNSECSICSSQLVCSACSPTYFLFNQTCIQSCPDPYYKLNNTCEECATPCLTCLSSHVCKSCSSLSFYNGTCLSICYEKYYSTNVTVMGVSVKECVPCVEPCVTCGSRTQCWSCKIGLVLYNNSCFSTCPQLYYDRSGICFACSQPCLACNLTGCLSCSDPSMYLEGQDCQSSCTVLHPNNITMRCESCKSPCSLCTWSDTCLNCINPFIFYGNECVRNCPDGKYNSNQSCFSCPSTCLTCHLVADEISCSTCVAGNHFYGYQCVDACPNGTYLQTPYCISKDCMMLTNCETCSNFRCLECSSNYTMNENSNKCELIEKNESIVSAVSEIPVPFPFLIALVTVLILGFLIRIEFTKMFTPLFIYAFAGIAEFGVLVLWIVLIYTRGFGENGTHLGLRIVATVIFAIYLLFNAIGFILYLSVTRKDRKFITWEKQDNKVSSILVTIVAFLISFRFSLLKFSKLGHIQKFSANLSKDSKLDHENILSYVSIPLISIPMVIAGAWIAYTQTTMNYLFFTSLEVSAIAVIMIVLSIVKGLSPKGYTLEKKEEYMQGHDADGLEGQSIEEIMVKMGIVEEEYNECLEIEPATVKKEHRGFLNDAYSDENSNEEARTVEALINHKGVDDKLSLESEIGLEENETAKKRRLITEIDERDEIDRILSEAETRAKELNRPSRPIGAIKKQKLEEFDEYSESEGIDSDDEFPQIENLTSPDNKSNILRSEDGLHLEKLGNDYDSDVGNRKLEELKKHLKTEEKEEEELRKRLESLSPEEKQLKLKEYEKAKLLLNQNKLKIEQKLVKVENMIEQKSKKELDRKEKIKEMRQERESTNPSVNINTIKSNAGKKNAVYPIHEENEETRTELAEKKNSGETSPNKDKKQNTERDNRQKLNERSKTKEKTEPNKIDIESNISQFKSKSPTKTKPQEISPTKQQKQRKYTEESGEKKNSKNPKMTKNVSDFGYKQRTKREMKKGNQDEDDSDWNNENELQFENNYEWKMTTEERVPDFRSEQPKLQQQTFYDQANNDEEKLSPNGNRKWGEENESWMENKEANFVYESNKKEEFENDENGLTISPYLEKMLDEIDARADQYIRRPKSDQSLDSEMLSNEVEPKTILFEEDEEEYEGNEEEFVEEKVESPNVISEKIPRRVNRSVMDLSPKKHLKK